MNGVVAAFASTALVSAMGSINIRASKDGVMHYDTAPSPISTTPTAVATPVGSLWQTDTVSLILILEASWALRDPRGCAWVSPSW